MIRYPLLHIVFHGNIHDTLCIKVDEFHHESASSKNSRQENYEILPKTLDKRRRDVLKSFQPAYFAVNRAAVATTRLSESRDRSKTNDLRPEVIRNQHVNNLRKALPALPRRHPVRNQARGTNSQVSAVHQTDRSSSGTRAIDANGATSSLTTGAIQSGVIHETHSQLKPRSRIGAFWLRPKQPSFHLKTQQRRQQYEADCDIPPAVPCMPGRCPVRTRTGRNHAEVHPVHSHHQPCASASDTRRDATRARGSRQGSLMRCISEPRKRSVQQT